MHYRFKREALYIGASSHLNFRFKVREFCYGIYGCTLLFQALLLQGFFNMNMDTSSQRASLRSQLRQQRRALSDEVQQQHAWSMAWQLSRHPLFRRGKHVAAYLAGDGEIDPDMLIHMAWKANKQVYLPVLAPLADRLYFAPYRQGCKLKPNRFNIPEPDVHPGAWIKPQQLDLILMPLVGFDTDGNRLGMGGGFYDRSLEFTRYRRHTHRPYLVGLAHQLQQVEQLPHQPHDVPMQLIATEQQIIQCQFNHGPGA